MCYNATLTPNGSQYANHKIIINTSQVCTAYSIDKILLVLADNRVRSVIGVRYNDGSETVGGQRQWKRGK